MANPNVYVDAQSLLEDESPSNARRSWKVPMLVVLVFLGIAAFLSSSHDRNFIDQADGASPTMLGAFMPVANPGSRAALPLSSNFRGVTMPVRGMHQTFNQYGITSGPLQELAVSAIEAANRCSTGRDVSANANFKNVFTNMGSKTQSQVIKMSQEAALKAEDMAGVIEPTGFFDPLGFTTSLKTGKLLFYREVELKHGRVCMLAALGIVVGENFHPLFGGDIDAPAAFAFQQTPLEQFWPAVVAAIAIPEVFSVFTFNEPFDYFKGGGPLWTMKEDRVPGDIGFDPLGLKPSDPEEFKTMQTKELNNGRLAMIATAGMIAQELATGQKLF
jgi:hypothetical protein